MYCGALGKIGNFQVEVSVHLVTDHASAAVDWRLFVPASWDPARIDPVLAREATRRQRCKIAPLVRQETQIAFPSLLRRFPGLAAAGRPERRDSLSIRGYLHLPITTG